MNSADAFTAPRSYGRIVAPDPRDRAYRLKVRNLLADESGPTQKHWTTGTILDQGQTSQCVEFSGRQWLASSPVRNKWPKPSGWLYHECQVNDEWPGEDYDGTSVRALFKVLQSLGYVQNYGWAWDNATVASWVLTKGPVVIGSDWLEGMETPGPSGFIAATGQPVGGHAYLLSGTNTRKLCPDGSLGAHRITNSWSKAWGDKGRTWISYRDMEKLLGSWGEAATAIEAKK